jgi:SEC-C motif-containing protein
MANEETGSREGDGADAWHRIPREREESLCPCKSWQPYGRCCLPFHQGKSKPETAEQLMRSRYSAYFFRLVDYLVETTHPETREPGLRQEIGKIIHQANWSYLSILGVAQGGKEEKRGKVEFVAEYFVDGEPYELHEISRFKRFKGAWKYLDGKG